MSEYKVLVGAVEYDLVKKGRAQAEQVGLLSKWLSVYGGAIKVDGALENGLDLVKAITGALSADALLALFVVVTGCTPAEAEEHFDVGILLDSVIIIYENQEHIKKVLSRFFSVESSLNASE